MKHHMPHPLPCLAFLLFCLSCAFPAWAQNAAAEPTTHIFHLRHFDDDFLRYVYLTIGNHADTAVKEPDLRTKRVVRGTLPTGTDPSDHMRFVWNVDTGRLYLDLNRNHDLTDDPVFEGGEKTDYWRRFNNIMLSSPRGPQYGLYTIDLEFSWFAGKCDSGRVVVRSGWQGEIELHGKKYLLAFVDNLDGRVTTTDTLILRPAGKALHYMYKEAIPRSGKLFLSGHLYEVSFAIEPAEDGGLVVSRWTEVPTDLVECEVTGRCIARLFFKRYDGTPVILDQPDRRVAIPVGRYFIQDVYVDGGPSVGVVSGGHRNGFEVSTTTPTVIRMGAPLRNTVQVLYQGWDNALGLYYDLQGADGEYYAPPNPDGKQTPRFAVYWKGIRIGSGSFQREMHGVHSFLWQVPVTAFGDLSIVASTNLGELGPTRGEPFVYHRRLRQNLPRLLPWALLVTLLFLPRNRGLHPKMALVVAMLVYWIFGEASRSSLCGDFNPFRYIHFQCILLYQAVGVGLCGLWLLSPFLSRLRRRWIIPPAAILLTAVASLAFWEEAGGEAYPGITAGLIAVFLASLTIVVALALGGVSCRNNYAPWRFTLWTAIWLLVVTVLACLTITAFFGDFRSFHEAVITLSLACGDMTIGSLAASLPYLALTFHNRVFRQRFYTIFRLPGMVEQIEIETATAEPAAQ